MAYWFVLSLLAMLLWGITGVTLKLSTNSVSAPFAFLGFTVAFFPVALLIAVVFPVHLPGSFEVVLLGVVGGALNGLGALTSLAALRAGGKASLVVPITYLYPLISVLAARFFLEETITARQWSGIALALAAAWLLSEEEDSRARTEGPPLVRSG